MACEHNLSVRKKLVQVNFGEEVTFSLIVLNQWLWKDILKYFFKNKWKNEYKAHA